VTEKQAGPAVRIGPHREVPRREEKGKGKEGKWSEHSVLVRRGSREEGKKGGRVLTNSLRCKRVDFILRKDLNTAHKSEKGKGKLSDNYIAGKKGGITGLNRHIVGGKRGLGPPFIGKKVPAFATVGNRRVRPVIRQQEKKESLVAGRPGMGRGKKNSVTVPYPPRRGNRCALRLEKQERKGILLQL